jgi:uncharacterized repeat protein (TIGR03803 family)
MRCRHSLFSFVASMFVLLMVVISSGAQTSKFKVLHAFAGGNDGAYPYAPVALDRLGNVYGTTSLGGSGTPCTSGCGTVFQLVPSGANWREKIIYTFSGSYVNPTGPLLVDMKGNLYGTTASGGDLACQCGQVYELIRSEGWTLNLIHNFLGGADVGAYPEWGTIMDSRGSLYGTTAGGGPNQAGTIFEFTPSSGGAWTENVLYTATSSTPNVLYSGLVTDSAGDLYTTSVGGGVYNEGTVFRLAPSSASWVESPLYAFTGGENGYGPGWGVVFDAAGNLYGTTDYGGYDAVGNVFKLTPASGGYWNFLMIHSFTGGRDGGFPQGPLLVDNAGNLYGETLYGGAYEYGTVYKIAPTNGVWKETVLHNFTGGTDGANPYGGLVLDSSGNLYGVASQGGANHVGVVFEITP